MFERGSASPDLVETFGVWGPMLWRLAGAAVSLTILVSYLWWRRTGAIKEVQQLPSMRIDGLPVRDGIGECVRDSKPADVAKRRHWGAGGQ